MVNASGLVFVEYPEIVLLDEIIQAPGCSGFVVCVTFTAYTETSVIFAGVSPIVLTNFLEIGVWTIKQCGKQLFIGNM